MTEMEKMIARINELAHKSKKEGLTDVEKEEQAILRRKYIDNIKAGIKAQMMNVEILEKDGSVTKMGDKIKEIDAKKLN